MKHALADAGHDGRQRWLVTPLPTNCLPGQATQLAKQTEAKASLKTGDAAGLEANDGEMKT